MNGTPIPWTFKSWISNFKGVDLPIGDLARSIDKDPNFPEDDSFSVILEHISDEEFLTVVHEHISAKVRSYQIVENFCFVWSFYQASR